VSKIEKSPQFLKLDSKREASNTSSYQAQYRDGSCSVYEHTLRRFWVRYETCLLPLWEFLPYVIVFHFMSFFGSPGNSAGTVSE